MAEHGGVVRGGARLSGLQLMDAQLLRLEEEFRRVVRREDARRALLTPQELEDERARKMGTRARVLLFLSYDYSYPPLQWTVVRQQEGDNLPPLEELARASSAGAQAVRGPSRRSACRCLRPSCSSTVQVFCVLAHLQPLYSLSSPRSPTLPPPVAPLGATCRGEDHVLTRGRWHS